MATGQAERLVPLLEEVLAEGGPAGATWEPWASAPDPATSRRADRGGGGAGLALGLGVPAIGVTSFEALAWGREGSSSRRTRGWGRPPSRPSGRGLRPRPPAARRAPARLPPGTPVLGDFAGRSRAGSGGPGRAAPAARRGHRPDRAVAPGQGQPRPAPALSARARRRAAARPPAVILPDEPRGPRPPPRRGLRGPRPPWTAGEFASLLAPGALLWATPARAPGPRGADEAEVLTLATDPRAPPPGASRGPARPLPRRGARPGRCPGLPRGR
jgi:hypothetical protein